MMSFGDVIISGDVILQCFVLCCKVDKIDVLCLGTIRGRGHSILLNGNQAKIVKALTCYLCPKKAAMIDVLWRKLCSAHALHSLPRKHRQYATLHSKTLFIVLFRSATRILLMESHYLCQRTVNRMTYNEKNGYHFWRQIWQWHRFSTFGP